MWNSNETDPEMGQGRKPPIHPTVILFLGFIAVENYSSEH